MGNLENQIPQDDLLNIFTNATLIGGGVLHLVLGSVRDYLTDFYDFCRGKRRERRTNSEDYIK